MLSYISMNPHQWQEHSYVACCGTSPIPVLQMLKLETQIVYLCLDNDKAGPVSYTHLRAHETGRNLVCRLLLEKKKRYPVNMDQLQTVTFLSLFHYSYFLSSL